MKRTVCNIDHSEEGAPQYHYIHILVLITRVTYCTRNTKTIVYDAPGYSQQGVHSQVLEDGVRIGQPLKHEVAIQRATNENNAHITLLIALVPCNSGAVRPITKHCRYLGLFRSHGTSTVIRSARGGESDTL